MKNETRFGISSQHETINFVNLKRTNDVSILCLQYDLYNNFLFNYLESIQLSKSIRFRSKLTTFTIFFNRLIDRKA